MNDNLFGNIETLLTKLGIQFTKKSDSQYIALCKFHNDKNPSMSINSEGLYLCWACGAKGNAHTLVKELTGQSLYKFLDIAPEKQSDVSFSTVLRNYQENASYKNQKPKVKEIPELKVVAEKVNPYTNELSKAYCIKRHILPSDIDKYNIFYIESGYIGITSFHKRLVIPIHDKKGNIIAYEGRDVTNYDPNGKTFSYYEGRDITGKAKKKCIYPYGSKIGSTIFQNHQLDRNKHTVFVEGVLDLIVAQRILSSIQFSTYFGIQLSNKQIKIVNEFKEVSLMLDPDDAGQIRGNLNFDQVYNGNLEICSLTRDDPNKSRDEEIISAFESRISITEFHLRNNDLLQKSAMEW